MLTVIAAPPSRWLPVPCDARYSVKRLGIAELRRSLYSLYSQYGRIMDVVALKTRKMRGQAFVVYSDIGSAVLATRNMNGFQFYGRAMRVTFAKSQSHAVQKEEGTFGRPAKKAKSAAQPSAAVAIATAAAASKPAAAAAAAPPADEGEAAAPMEDDQPPNSILYLSGLPENAKAEGVDIEEMLEMLFGTEAHLEGLQEVRLVSNRPDIAFVEYANEDQAAAAKDRLQGFNLTPENKLSIIYAKK